MDDETVLLVRVHSFMLALAILESSLKPENVTNFYLNNNTVNKRINEVPGDWTIASSIT